ncbi:MAG: hypothetical protein AUG74_08185 [Bacteroidetes bacterium 13_1_20CM_4_60_6]|nr:MAG: hypothetical protein AUG74_08185 [Bacteroidetes bacterium 13_1_20CM_4_60_6]
MSDNLKDILSNLNPDIDQETLLLYLQGRLSAEKQHELEKQIIDSEFDSDAVEGLQYFNDKKNISDLINQLNKDLKKRTEKKKRAREKLQLSFEPWILITILLLLALVIISYVIIKHQLHQ